MYDVRQGRQLKLAKHTKQNNVIARLNRTYRDTKQSSLQNAMQLFTKQDTSTRRDKAAAQCQYCNYIDVPVSENSALWIAPDGRYCTPQPF
jgi:hypothetical protein